MCFQIVAVGGLVTAMTDEEVLGAPRSKKKNHAGPKSTPKDAINFPTAARVFGEMGSTPTRPATQANHAAAVKLLNEFLALKGVHPIPKDKNEVGNADVCTEAEVCQVSILRQFATFLKEATNSLESREEEGTWRFRPGTGKQRLGDVKGQIERVFGKDCWVRNDPVNSCTTGTRFNERGADAWYSILRKNLSTEMFHRCWLSGYKCGCCSVSFSWIVHPKVNWLWTRLLLATGKKILRSASGF